MSKQVVVNKNSISTLSLLGVVFVTLKLCGVISWSWWWVTAPFWGWSALLLAILAGGGLLFLVALAGAWCIDTYRKIK